MTYRLTKILRGYQPLYSTANSLILLKGRTLYRSDPDLGAIERICDLPYAKAIGRIPSRLLARIFRLGADSAIALDGDWLLIARRSTIYRVSLSSGEWHIDLQLHGGARSLNLSEVIVAGERTICFGEYVTAFDGRPINIWRRGSAPGGSWSISGTFAAGEVDHIHNIVQLPDGSIYALSGDSDDRSGIWAADEQLTKFSPIAIGSQSVRSCWLWQAPSGDILYATDSQFAVNYVRKLDTSPQGNSPVDPICGSSIHAFSDPDRVIFSTAVEPGALTGRRLRDIFDRTPGPAILGNASAIYANDGGATIKLHEARKDVWPMRLAQFGTFQFPKGKVPADRFYAYGVAVQGSDGCCLLFKR